MMFKRGVIFTPTEAVYTPLHSTLLFVSHAVLIIMLCVYSAVL